ncbi:hypothetical protein CFIMG_008395RA00001 [Ceratocystis fimbriata CBS 114723]|uniref:37S ribosomal protein mrp51, mitochondrial n=1 Tax=Ceratocystis fimbriata CBS 114723 TaxID=1035309 RepID=A0A2C5X439_9PEZI|nr:hypothetical protein CFIMG_008395RA00001 [Ceratocystis fimbriata CBS 114723]
MATQRVSPGARLLRTSRMFSMPKPLPVAHDSVANIYATPTTATAPYPTSQAISSPLSSRAKGDWGLKRPLPLKTTLNTTTPMIRVKAIDAVEKVTDFNSAADHGLTLQKFQELGVALTMPVSHIHRVQSGKVSVFEEDYDFTAINEKPNEVSHKRWKFKGPWLGGMTEGQFKKYLISLRQRKPEFREFVRAKLAAEVTQNEAREAMEQGKGTAPPPKTASEISEEMLNDYFLRLRDDSARFNIYSYVSEFLDLAPIAPPNQGSKEADVVVRPVSPYANEGPPKCHPSAGLSYLRTSQFLSNHPLYGPQKYRLTRARILSPWKGSEVPKLGVAGVITDIPLGQNRFNVRTPAKIESEMSNVPGILNFNPEIVGGAKVHVNPKMARVDSQGRIILTVDESQPECNMVYEELQGRKKVYHRDPKERAAEKAASEAQPVPYRRPKKLYQHQANVLGSVQNYGLGQ